MKVELNIDSKILKKAKKLAKEQNSDLDQLVESYLRKLVTKKDIIISEEVKQLPKGLKMPKKESVEDAKYNYLAEKYL